MGDNTDQPAAPKWIYDDVVPAIGSRVRSLHLLKQKGSRKSVLLFTEEAALVAEKSIMSGVKVYRVDYPRGLLLNESNCPHCGKMIREPVGKIARVAKGAKPPAPKPVEKLVKTGPGGHPVIDIEGIGPVYADKLAKRGIHTMEELRNVNGEDLAERIGAAPASVRQWQSMADLIRINGIGPQFAELLVRAGIGSIGELRKADPKKLAATIEEVNADRKVRIQRGPAGLKSVKNWIAAAKRHK